MEVIFILGVVTFILIRFVSKSFNSATIIESSIPNKPIIIEKKGESPFLNSKNEGNYMDIPQNKKNRNNKKNEAISLNTSSTKVNTSENKIQESNQIIKLNNINQARKAFIYSEIFNRKY